MHHLRARMTDPSATEQRRRRGRREARHDQFEARSVCTRATACWGGPTCSFRTCRASGSTPMRRRRKQSPSSPTTVRPSRSHTSATMVVPRKCRPSSTWSACVRTVRSRSTASSRSVASPRSARHSVAAAPRSASRSATAARGCRILSDGEPATKTSEPLEKRNGAVAVDAAEDGPLLVSGSLEIRARRPRSRRFARRQDAAPSCGRRAEPSAPGRLAAA